MCVVHFTERETRGKFFFFFFLTPPLAPVLRRIRRDCRVSLLVEGMLENMQFEYSSACSCAIARFHRWSLQTGAALTVAVGATGIFLCGVIGRLEVMIREERNHPKGRPPSLFALTGSHVFSSAP